MRMLSSGPMKIRRPSRWEAKVTPSSVIFRRPARENTWKPPESVRMGPSQSHELVQAAHLPHHVVAGTQVQVVGVGQLDLAAQLLQIEGVRRRP